MLLNRMEITNRGEWGVERNVDMLRWIQLRPKVVIPKSRVREMLEETHGETGSRHFGTAKTHRKLPLGRLQE